MNDLFSILFAFLFYSIWFFTYNHKTKNIFFSIFILLIIFHDYIFIHLGYLTSETVLYIIKSWQEYLLVFIILVLAFKKRLFVGKEVLLIVIGILLISVWGVLIGIVRGITLFEVYLGWRSYILPLLLTLLLFISGAFHGVNAKYILRLITALGILSVLGAIYQTFIFSGYNLLNPVPINGPFTYHESVLSKFWFYEKFGSLHMLRSWPNYFRDGALRSTSFFVSPIMFSEFLIIPILILIVKINQLKSLNILNWYWIIILTFLYGIYLSNTRIGILLVILCVFIVFILFKQKISTGIYWTLIIGAIISVFFGLIVLNIGDESAQGRLAQYASLINYFSVFGHGFGSKFSVAYYDSLYISVSILFGLGAIVYFVIHYIIVQLIYSHFSDVRNELVKSYIVISVTAALIFSFAFAFQYSIDSSAIRLVYFLFFYTIHQVFEWKHSGY